MKPRNKTIRVFLSSTFEDLKMERDALQQKAFHNLREYCREKGWQFQAVDLRWGINNEATIDQRTMEICLRELARCQEQSPRPNFIILLGERYGWRPLPDRILKSVASDMAKEMPADIQSLFKQWYELDENQLPEPIWKLRAREGRFIDYNEFDKAIQKPLIEFFTKWSELNLPDPDQPEHAINPLAQQRLSMERSATEQEIHAGAFRVEDATEHVFAFFRNLPGCPKNNTIYHDPDQQPVQRLRRHVISFLPKNNISEFPAGWNEINDRPDVTHLEQLSNDVEKYLKAIIDKEIEHYQLSDELEMEQGAHEAFARERTFGFSGRDKDIKAIGDYVLQDHKAPFVLWGASGTGKSSLLAMAMDQVRNKMPQVLVIARFIGVTGKSSNGHSLLYDICSRICLLYGGDQSSVPQEPAKLQIAFKEYLSKATVEHPLILFLDALDQFNENDTARQLSWLPYKLPPHVSIIFSTLKVDCFDILQERENPHPLFYEITPLTADDGRTALGAWLQKANRTLQPHQKDQIIKDFEYAGCAPLYLHLAFTQAQHWESFRSKERLGRDIPEMIEDLYRKLSDPKSHGPIVKEVLTAIRCAKQGLSDDEILGILAADDDFFNRFGAQTYHVFNTSENGDARKRQIPPVLWIRLYHDLEYYLTRRNAPGGAVITFYHRQLAEAVDGVYLEGSGVKQKKHKELAQFFKGQSSLIKEKSPLIANIRKCDELPWQLIKSEDWDAAVETLCNLDFIQAKAVAKMTYDLVSDFNAALLAIPDNQENIKKENEQQARMDRYTRDLILYAKGEITTLEVPESISPWTKEQYDKEIDRLKTNPTRLDRLKDFYNFLGNEAFNLQDYASDYSHFVYQQAWNYAVDGPLGTSAEQALSEIFINFLLFSQQTRPAWNPIPKAIKTLKPNSAAVSITPDGKRAVSDSSENSLILWDLTSGETIQTLIGHTEGVNAVSITPDGKRAFSGSDDNTCILWDLTSGETIQTLIGHTDKVNAVSITPDGKRAFSGSDDNTCILWDLNSGKTIQTLIGHTDKVVSVSITPDGKKAVSGSDDNTCILWDLTSGKVIQTLIGHTDTVYAVSITPDGKKAVSGSWDKTCILWDLTSGKAIQTLIGHTDTVNAVSITPDGKKAVSGSWDKTCILWDLTSGKVIQTLIGHTDYVFDVSITPDGKKAVSGSNDGTCILWDLTSEEVIKTLVGHTDDVKAVSTTPNGKSALSGSYDNTCILWDLTSGKAIQTLIGHTDTVNAVSITPDGKKAVSGSDDNTCILWDLTSGKAIQTLIGHTHRVNAVSITPDGKKAVSGSDDGTCILWDLTSGKAIQTLIEHTLFGYKVKAISITPDSKKAVSGSDDGTNMLWDFIIGKRIWMLRINLDGAVSIAPDGKLFLSCSNDKYFNICDLTTGKAIRTLIGHTKWVHLVSITPDGKRAFSCSYDNTCILWDLTTGEAIRTYSGHTHPVREITFTPDGNRAFTCSDDNTCILWDLEKGEKLGFMVVRSEVISIGFFTKGIVIGCAAGEVIILNIHKQLLRPGRGIVTIRQIWDFEFQQYQEISADCPLCGHRFAPPSYVLDTIENITKEAGLKPGQSPCLELPKEVWGDKGLLGECPECGEGLKFNPFIAGGDDWISEGFKEAPSFFTDRIKQLMLNKMSSIENEIKAEFDKFEHSDLNKKPYIQNAVATKSSDISNIDQVQFLREIKTLIMNGSIKIAILKLSNLKPRNDILQNALGVCYLRSGMLNKAIEIFLNLVREGIHGWREGAKLICKKNFLTTLLLLNRFDAFESGILDLRPEDLEDERMNQLIDYYETWKLTEKQRRLKYPWLKRILGMTGKPQKFKEVISFEFEPGELD